MYEFPWQTFCTVLSFVWGACVGSFLNVCVHRIPRELSVVRPRSFCPACRRSIAWYHNVPILSFLLLRGRCARCGARISPRYVTVEALTGLLFLLVWLKYDPDAAGRPLALAPLTHWPLVPVYWVAVAGLILGTFVDFEHLIIPDRVTLGGIAAGVGLSALFPAAHGESAAYAGAAWALAGAALGWGVLWLIAVLGGMLFRKEAMGFGDVKLLGAIGAFLGWRAVLFTIVASSFVGSLVGLTLVLLKRRRMQSRIPYGPYLAMAAVLWILWGPLLWARYMALLAPVPPPY
ncbi:MAG: prepilin peptidase [Lentisphaerae bacterium]|nr:prepilin peptidase [Lentisphaerota bacterium]